MQCMKAYLPITSHTRKPRARSDSESSKQIHFKINPDSVKSITSTSNPFVKHCVKLRQSSSYRNSHSSVLVLGSTPVREILRFQESLEQKTAAIECLILLDEAKVPEEVNGFPVRVVRVSNAVMKKLCGLQSAESTELIGLMRIPTSFIDLVDPREAVSDCGKWFPVAHRILVLDAIQDPGNLGTLIRSALAFRWDGVFLLPGCCDPFNDKAIRASRGASFQLPMVCGNWAHLEALRAQFRMKTLAGHPGSQGGGTELVLELSHGLADSLAHTPLCLVLGSEGSGLSERARRECQLVRIPMAGQFESLNVSIAGGIFLYSFQAL